MKNVANKISVIIPMLNEAGNIKNLVTHIAENSTRSNIEEIIIVDGGSNDGSRETLAKFKNITLLESQKGRAQQMNIGAQAASGGIFYFLHADSYPPPNFDRQIIDEIDKNNNVGCFRLKFDHAYHPLLKVSQWFTRFNFSLFRGGDQSLFVTRKIFDELKGFDEHYIIYEDIEFIIRVYRTHYFSIINDYVVTAVRKFRMNGVWKLHLIFFIIHFKNWLGASADELHKYYLKNIKV